MDPVRQRSARSASAARWTRARSHRSLTPIVALVALLVLLSAGRLDAQALALTITKDFSPSTVVLNGTSTATITVTNPNAFPVSNVQFSDIMPAGIQLITQLGGTCGTPATGGGMFTINPGTGTFSSTSSVLAAGQFCSIVVQVRGTVLGPHVNVTSLVTGTGTPDGGPASATLTVLAPSPTPTSTPSPTPTGTATPTPTNTPIPVAAPAVPTLSFPMLALLGLVLAAAGLFLARRQ